MIYYVIERYINNKLLFYCAGAIGRSAKENWADDHEWSTKFADDRSAQQTLVNICCGEGRVVEYNMVKQ